MSSDSSFNSKYKNDAVKLNTANKERKIKLKVGKSETFNKIHTEISYYDNPMISTSPSKYIIKFNHSKKPDTGGNVNSNNNTYIMTNKKESLEDYIFSFSKTQAKHSPNKINKYSEVTIKSKQSNLTSAKEIIDFSSKRQKYFRPPKLYVQKEINEDKLILLQRWIKRKLKLIRISSRLSDGCIYLESVLIAYRLRLFLFLSLKQQKQPIVKQKVKGNKFSISKKENVSILSSQSPKSFIHDEKYLITDTQSFSINNENKVKKLIKYNNHIRSKTAMSIVFDASPYCTNNSFIDTSYIMTEICKSSSFNIIDKTKTSLLISLFNKEKKIKRTRNYEESFSLLKSFSKWRVNIKNTKYMNFDKISKFIDYLKYSFNRLTYNSFSSKIFNNTIQKNPKAKSIICSYSTYNTYESKFINKFLFNKQKNVLKKVLINLGLLRPSLINNDFTNIKRYNYYMNNYNAHNKINDSMFNDTSYISINHQITRLDKYYLRRLKHFFQKYSKIVNNLILQEKFNKRYKENNISMIITYINKKNNTKQLFKCFNKMKYCSPVNTSPNKSLLMTLSHLFKLRRFKVFTLLENNKIDKSENLLFKYFLHNLTNKLLQKSFICCVQKISSVIKLEKLIKNQERKKILRLLENIDYKTKTNKLHTANILTNLIKTIKYKEIEDKMKAFTKILFYRKLNKNNAKNKLKSIINKTTSNLFLVLKLSFYLWRSNTSKQLMKSELINNHANNKIIAMQLLFNPLAKRVNSLLLLIFNKIKSLSKFNKDKITKTSFFITYLNKILAEIKRKTLISIFKKIMIEKHTLNIDNQINLSLNSNLKLRRLIESKIKKSNRNILNKLIESLNKFININQKFSPFTNLSSFKSLRTENLLKVYNITMNKTCLSNYINIWLFNSRSINIKQILSLSKLYYIKYKITTLVLKKYIDKWRRFSTNSVKTNKITNTSSFQYNQKICKVNKRTSALSNARTMRKPSKHLSFLALEKERIKSKSVLEPRYKLDRILNEIGKLSLKSNKKRKIKIKLSTRVSNDINTSFISINSCRSEGDAMFFVEEKETIQKPKKSINNKLASNKVLSIVSEVQEEPYINSNQSIKFKKIIKIKKIRESIVSPLSILVNNLDSKQLNNLSYYLNHWHKLTVYQSKLKLLIEIRKNILIRNNNFFLLHKFEFPLSFFFSRWKLNSLGKDTAYRKYSEKLSSSPFKSTSINLFSTSLINQSLELISNKGKSVNFDNKTQIYKKLDNKEIIYHSINSSIDNSIKDNSLNLDNTISNSFKITDRLTNQDKTKTLTPQENKRIINIPKPTIKNNLKTISSSATSSPKKQQKTVEIKKPSIPVNNQASLKKNDILLKKIVNSKFSSPVSIKSKSNEVSSIGIKKLK